jgi:galactosylceramidase
MLRAWWSQRVSIVAWTAAVLVTVSLRAEPLLLDAQQTGREFAGVGGVSAGASSRLLVDYPEPQRSQILDYLFKPNYGASLQHLKVEIGGDVNSTDGIEASHMHTRTDENYHRGYEWWLMKEARKRNPRIILDTLAWGAPYWIGDGQFYSQDMADYVVKFIQGAKRVYGLDINYTGIWNERPYNVEWVKLLRKTLDANGLKTVGIIAADQCTNDWGVVADLSKDPAFKAATAAIGVHYPETESTPAALASGLPLWSSEDGPWSGEWMAAWAGSKLPLQATYNRNYIVGKMTKTAVWSPITCYYDNLPLPGSGLMRANTPWSGHYEVQPALWVTAHTTQFAQPGWKYLDGACRLLPYGGSCVGLLAPNGRDYSIILETTGAKAPQQVVFALARGLSHKPLHVWRTDARHQFERMADLKVTNSAEIGFTAPPESVYSLTTTTGQRKGKKAAPVASAFPVHYQENFSSYAPGSTPRYFCDFSGCFEVVRRNDGQGNALRQVVEHKGVEWQPDTLPETFVGDPDLENYSVSVDAMIENAGLVSLFGRVASVHQNADPPNGYWLKVGDTGAWELLAAGTRLINGTVPFSAKTWHRLQLDFANDRIAAMIDGHAVAQVIDETFAQGNTGLGCGWHTAQFSHFEIRTAPSPPNLAQGKPASASSEWSAEYAASRANDGKSTTRWNAANGKAAGEWLELNFGQPTTFNQIVQHQFGERITRYEIQYWDGGQWVTILTSGPMRAVQRDRFPAVTASKVRLLVQRTRNGETPSIFEFKVYLDPPPSR